MISSKYQPINKAWREYSPKKIFKFLKTIFFSIKWLFRYSGLEFIYTKFNPPKNPQRLPTGFIWLIGIYLAFFGVASQRHDSRIDIIENRANSIFAQLAVPSVAKKALSRIPRVQNMSCPYKPSLLNPLSVFISLFSDSKYEEVRAQLKETIEDWKDSLDSVNLSEAILRGADLRGAYLGKAYLRGAKELTVEQLCKASVLYEAKLDRKLEAQIKQECPDLLKKPQFNDLFKIPQFYMR